VDVRHVALLAHITGLINQEPEGRIFGCREPDTALAPAEATAGCPGWRDFFSVGGADLGGLATYYVLSFLHLESRRVTLAGITRHPTEAWMEQIG
jgi:hypothetical protein